MLEVETCQRYVLEVETCPKYVLKVETCQRYVLEVETCQRYVLEVETCPRYMLEVETCQRYLLWRFINTRVTHYVLQSGFSTTQPLCLLQFFEEPPLSLYTLDHPLKPAVYDTRPRWLGYVKNDALDECSGIFGVLKLLIL